MDIPVERGTTIGLVGPNGSGKTTFFVVLTDLYRWSAGRASLADEDIFPKLPQAIGCPGVAPTFQRCRLMLDYSVFDNVALGALRHQDLGLAAQLFRPRLRASLDALVERVWYLANRFNPAIAASLFEPPGRFTMNDRRRIELCRALIANPRLLLLDEPSAGMTSEETRRLMDDLVDFRRERPDLAVILVEHEMYVIRRVSDWCSVPNFGRKIFEGAFEALIEDRDIQTAYSGSGQRARLAWPSRGNSRSHRSSRVTTGPTCSSRSLSTRGPVKVGADGTTTARPVAGLAWSSRCDRGMSTRPGGRRKPFLPTRACRMVNLNRAFGLHASPLAAADLHGGFTALHRPHLVPNEANRPSRADGPNRFARTG